MLSDRNFATLLDPSLLINLKYFTGAKKDDKENVERYDTTIGIPTNLADGYYSLRVSMLVGNALKPYNSCGKLKITGGNPNFNCRSSKKPIKYTCQVAAGPRLIAISAGIHIIPPLYVSIL